MCCYHPAQQLALPATAVSASAMDLRGCGGVPRQPTLLYCVQQVEAMAVMGPRGVVSAVSPLLTAYSGSCSYPSRCRLRCCARACWDAPRGKCCCWSRGIVALQAVRHQVYCV
jgi:hypothetical protein